MQDNTNWTPYRDDNLLKLTDINLINEFEAKGLVAAELFVFELDTESLIAAPLINS